MASLKYRGTWPQLRAIALRRLIPGTPCRRCGKPMWHSQPLDLGHPTDGHAGLALEHRSCNRAAGARNSNLAQAGKPRPHWHKHHRPPPSGRRW